MTVIAVVDYHLGNLRSVKCALDQLGQTSVVTSDPTQIAQADAVIFPGVGAFHHAMENLDALRLTHTLRDFALSGKPFLGICLGLQLLFAESTEHGTHPGLDLLPGRVVRFPQGQKVPQMGWNEVEQALPSPLYRGVPDRAFFYFAHSYHVVPDDEEVVIGHTDYGIPYASAVQKNNMFGVQFHPEKSGPVACVSSPTSVASLSREPRCSPSE